MGTTQPESKCLNCAALNPPGETFCVECGAALMSVPTAETASDLDVGQESARPESAPAESPPIEGPPLDAQIRKPGVSALIGTLLNNRYRVDGLVGRGGMSTVYRAFDTRLKIDVAVKEMILPSPEFSEMFQREATLLSKLSHPGIVRVIDYFRERDHDHLVMDFVEGETLDHVLQRQGVCLEPDVLRWAAQMLDQLQYLHSRTPPVVHRDIKPDNYMLLPGNQIKLIDFGIARLIKPGQARDTVAMGTPGYAAPEQHLGAQTDERSDVYSLGATLYQLLTGFDVTESPSFVRPRTRQLNAAVSRRTELALTKAMEVDPAQRFQSVEEMRRALIGGVDWRQDLDAALQRESVQEWLRFLPLLAGLAVVGSILGVMGICVLNLIQKLPPWVSTLLLFVFAVVATVAGLIVMGRRERSRTVDLPRQVEGPTTEIGDLLEREAGRHLTDFIVSDRGPRRLLLTGYGNFGGTTIVNTAVKLARQEMDRRYQDRWLLLVFRFEVDDEDGAPGAGRVRANDFLLGASHHPRDKNVLTVTQVLATHPDSVARIFGGATGLWRVTCPPLDESFFTGWADYKRPRVKADYTLDAFAKDFKRLLEKGRDARDLYPLIHNLIESRALACQMVFVLDRVSRLETLERLFVPDRFKTDPVKVIAVARQEHLDEWRDARFSLRRMKFDPDASYVPCMWQSPIEYDAYQRRVEQIVQERFGDQGIDAELLRRHVEYMGRGVLGSMWWKLHSIERPGRDEIEHNAWLQEMIELNWQNILPFPLGANRVRDARVRLAVYDLLSWISDHPFRQDQLLGLPLSVNLDEDTLKQVVEELVRVLDKLGYVHCARVGDEVKLGRPRTRPGRPRRVPRPKGKVDTRPLIDESELLFAPERSATMEAALSRERAESLAAATVRVSAAPTIPAHPTDLTPEQSRTLRMKLCEYYTMDELRTICADLDVDFESLGGESKEGKARELISYLERQARIHELLQVCAERRPHVQWKIE